MPNKNKEASKVFAAGPVAPAGVSTRSLASGEKMLEDNPYAEPMAVTTPMQALSAFNRLQEQFDSALANKAEAEAVAIFRLADQFEREVLKPNGISRFVDHAARTVAQYGDPEIAKSYANMNIGGFRRKAVERGVDIDDLLTKSSPRGLRANYPELSYGDAEKLAQANLGNYSAEEHVDAPIVFEMARIINRFPDNLDTRQAMFNRLKEGHAMLESQFSDVGTPAERARVAPDLGRLAYATDTDSDIIGPFMRSLVNVFQSVESVEGTGDGLVGAPTRSKERVLESAVATLAFVYKEAPAYAPDVMRMFAKGFVDEREIATGMTPAALAHRLVRLAPAVRAVEEAAAVFFPGNEPDQKNARAEYTRTMLRGIANDKGVGLYEPDAEADQKAARLLEKTTVLAVDPGDPTAAIAVAAQATGREPIAVIRRQVEQAVKSNRLTQAEGDEVMSAMQTISVAESDPRVRDVYQVVKDTDPTSHTFSVLVDELRIPGSDPHNPQRQAAAAAIDSARSKGRPAAGGAPMLFKSVDAALAKSAGLPSDAAASDDFATRSKLGQVRRGYDAIWGLVFDSSESDLSRRLESGMRTASRTIAGVRAWFTDEDAPDAMRRDFLEGSTKIGGVTIKHADLVQNDAELDYLIGLTHVRPDGVPELRGKNPYSAAARFRAFADRALMQGWLVYDPGKGTLAINSKVDPKSFRVKGGGDTKVTFDAPWIAPDVQITVDVFDPVGVATAMGAVTFQSDIEDPEARRAEWARRAASLASVGGTVRNLDGSMAALRQYGPELRRATGGSTASGGPVRDLVQMVANRVVDQLGAGGQRGRSKLQAAEAAKQEEAAKLRQTRNELALKAKYDKNNGLSPATVVNAAARLAAASTKDTGGDPIDAMPRAVDAVLKANVTPSESEEDDEDDDSVLLPHQFRVLE